MLSYLIIRAYLSEVTSGLVDVKSLSGHSSPVEAVCFGRLEDVVAAGSLSGSLKIWDLEASKSLSLSLTQDCSPDIPGSRPHFQSRNPGIEHSRTRNFGIEKQAQIELPNWLQEVT